MRAGGTRVRLQDGVEAYEAATRFEMSGKATYRLAAQRLPGFLRSLFDKAGVEIGDLKRLVPHQPSPCLSYTSPGIDLPLDLRGTAFQQRVWRALRQIPPGETASYAQIAQRVGSPTSVRAVAGACAANTLAVAIPCHRVVRSDGGLSGYRWGVERKQALLECERPRPDA